MSKIQKTKDHSKFEPLPFNRPVEKTKTLRKSMQKYGWLDAHPMHCVRNETNGKLRIKAGNHRFRVAKELGMPAKYVVCRDDITVFELEASTNIWTMNDYLIAFIRKADNPAYGIVRGYIDRTGISTWCAVAMLAGSGASNTKTQKAFKEGRFELGDTSHAESVGELVVHLKDRCEIGWAHNSMLVKALSRVVWVKEFNIKQFKKKAKTFKSLIDKQPSVDDYVLLIETIYNRRNREKIPLSFLAREMGLARSAVPKK